MTQFHFLATPEDCIAVIETVIRDGDTVAVPDFTYQTPEPTYLYSLNEEAKSAILEYRAVYFWSQNFTKFPPTLSKVEEGQIAGKYIIDDSIGPSLKFCLPPTFWKQKVLQLKYGHISYYSQYYNAVNDEFEKPSADLKLAYKKTVRLAKEHLVRLNAGNDVWIGKLALELMKKGKAVIASEFLI